LVAQGGWRGIVSSKERGAIYTFLHFYMAKNKNDSAPFYTFLHFYTAKNKNDSPPFYTFLHVLHG
jgi:hypothetical protein